MYIYPQSRFLVILCQPLCISVVFPRVCMLLLVSVKQVTNFMVAVKEPVVVFETKDGGFLFGNYLFFHYDRKSSTPYMSVEMRSGLYPHSLSLFSVPVFTLTNSFVVSNFTILKIRHLQRLGIFYCRCYF